MPNTSPAKNMTAPTAAPDIHIGAPQAAMIKSAIPSSIIFMDFSSVPPFLGHRLIWISFFHIQLVKMPAQWIFADVFYVLLIILTVADDVVVKIPLPYVYAIFFV